MKDSSLLSPSAPYSAQELSEASLAAKNTQHQTAQLIKAQAATVPPSDASFPAPATQPRSSSSAKSRAPAAHGFKELVCLKSNPSFEREHGASALSGVLISAGASTLQTHSFLLYLNEM